MLNVLNERIKSRIIFSIFFFSGLYIFLFSFLFLFFCCCISFWLSIELSAKLFFVIFLFFCGKNVCVYVCVWLIPMHQNRSFKVSCASFHQFFQRATHRPKVRRCKQKRKMNKWKKWLSKRMIRRAQSVTFTWNDFGGSWR